MFTAGDCVLSVPDGYGRKEPGGYWVRPWLKKNKQTPPPAPKICRLV